ncbi:MAG: bifunctional glutamate N-acetyltransferase/amino-acid acetyltransferase ArgJ [Candidatus Dadabacteria bacterium]|nr:bifunctional glutamate N-acetyltransferase/amino-acid acetyltransferase ArgJ [Candidatus Dadabacteria bacterium]MCZ6864516.1 bifunctional glutamate N-acetyltransferase/amino-acid acetyltransferase ArgJ [Candidatus Dadabacteria bacterium]
MITIPGFLGSGVSSGVKKKGKKDLALIFSEVPAKAVGVFTTNIVKAPPVLVGMDRIKSGYCQAVLINSGVANAFTGKEGLKDSILTSKYAANELGIAESLVIPSSTGVIGERLPTDKMKKALPKLVKDLRKDGFLDVAEGIMTTDTFPKYSSTKIRIGNKTGTIVAIGKGAGMIAPNMATMLAYILTDINIGRRALTKALKNVVSNSFNKIIVDGDTSTNDTVLLLANGKLGNTAIKESGSEYRKFERAVTEVATEVAEMIVQDGEGATKVAKIIVKGAKTEKDAQKIARTVGTSLLVKTAFFGEDPNWGRIVAAAGRAGVNFDPNKIDLFFGDQKILSNSKEVMNEKKAQSILKKPKFEITLNIKSGKASSFVIASDITFEYVKINANYRT